MSGRWSTAFLQAAVIAVWAWICIGLLRFWPLNADEGFYLAASRAVAGGWLPYRDFAYTQTPLLPYLNAPLLGLFSWSIGGIRAASMVLTGLSLIAAVRLCRLSLGLAGGLACFALFFMCVDTLGFLAIGKTYAAAQLLFLLAALPLFGNAPWKQGVALLSVLGALCIGVRLTMAPAVAVLWAGYWVLHRREASAAWMVGLPAACMLAIAAPFVASDPAAFAYFNWVFHRASLAPHHPAGFWPAAAAYLPGVWLLVAGASLHLPGRPTAERVLFLASVSGIVANLVLAGTYLEYITPFVLPAILGSIMLLFSGASSRAVATTFGAALVVSSVMIHTPPPSGCIADADAAAQFLASHAAEGTSVLASMPEIAVEARRPLYRNLVMGKFTVTGDYPSPVASRLGMVAIGDLIASVERREPGAIVLSRSPSGNFLYSLPSNLRFTAVRGRLLAAMLRGYEVAYSNATYRVLLPRAQPLKADPDIPGDL